MKPNAYLFNSSSTNEVASQENIEAEKRNIGLRLKRLLVEKSMSQSDLARKAGIGRDRISNYVNGKVRRSQEGLGKLAKALDVSAYELATGSAISSPDITKDEPSEETVEVKSLNGGMLVRVRKVLPTAVALEIVRLAQSNPATDSATAKE